MIRDLDFSGPPLVMAIVNCNKDSFYAPSRAMGEDALAMSLAAEKNGASIIDFGSESTRPGSSYISAEDEIQYLIPAIKMFREHSDLPVSADTRKAIIAEAALNAGADIINDISALTDDPAMGTLCADRGAWIVLMHKKGVPGNMQDSPHYDNLILEMQTFFYSAIDRALGYGIKKEKIILDPGIGFGKTVEDNIEILERLDEIFAKDYPVLVGLSRKSFIGQICGNDDVQETSDRLAGTLAANTMAIMKGARIIRVHDVKENVDLCRVIFAIKNHKNRKKK